MVEKLSEPTTGYVEDGDGVAVNHQENEKLVVVEDEEVPMKGRRPPSSNNKVWASVKPFVNGGLAGFLACSQFYFSGFVLYRLAKGTGAPEFKHLLSSYHTMFKGMPRTLLLSAAYRSLELGSFETLTRKVKTANKVMPLTIHQEVYCGLASGAITACIRTPIDLAWHRMGSDATLSNILHNLYHTAKDKGVLALWKDGRHATSCSMAMSMVNLVSYNRSYNYFRESLGVGETGAILGAGAVSGFCDSACCVLILNVNATMKCMRRNDATGKYSYTGFLDCAFKLWKSHGARPFNAGFPKAMARTPIIMATWWNYEEIRKKNPMD